jgi:hypothetical protein
MPKTVTVEYTNPATGAQSVATVTVDIEKYRKDTESGAAENFFLKASASGVTDVVEDVDALIADLLDGKPSSAGHGVVQAYVDAEFEAYGTSLSVTPSAQEAGFQAGVPCVVMSRYGTVLDYFIPTEVGADFVLEGSAAGHTAACLGVDVPVGAIVQQVRHAGSPLGENSVLGVKAQLEQPGPPSVSAVASGGTGIRVTLNAPASRNAVVKAYDIYVSDSELGSPPRIEPNRVADKQDWAGPGTSGSAQVVVDTYGGGSAAGGGSIGSGTWYVVAVAKDGSGFADVNESPLSNVAVVAV